MRVLLMALIVTCMGPVFTSAARGDVQVASIFGSRMVLQGDVPVPVWGTADPGERVTVHFAGQSVSAVADPQGRWLVELPAMAPNDKPRSMTIQGKATSIALEDVRVGEVWLLLANDLPWQYSVESPVPVTRGRIRSEGGSST